MGTTRHQIPHVVQHALRPTIPIGSVPTTRTRLPSMVPFAAKDLRLGQVLHARDALGGVGHVFSRSGHGATLLGFAFPPENLAQTPRRVIVKTR